MSYFQAIIYLRDGDCQSIPSSVDGQVFRVAASKLCAIAAFQSRKLGIAWAEVWRVRVLEFVLERRAF